MNMIETDYWCLMLPTEWSAEQSDDVVLITDQDGIGELALTTLVRASRAGEEITSTDIAKEKSPEISVWHAAEYGGFTGVTGHFEDTGSVITEWYLTYGDALLYITYACHEEDYGLDAAAVDEILSTLVRGDALAT